MSTEIGKDEDSTQTLQRKLEALRCEIESFKATLEHLTLLSDNITERQHFDAKNVQLKRVSLVLLKLKDEKPVGKL